MLSFTVLFNVYLSLVSIKIVHAFWELPFDKQTDKIIEQNDDLDRTQSIAETSEHSDTHVFSASHMLTVFHQPTPMSIQLGKCGHFSMMARQEMHENFQDEDMIAHHENKWLDDFDKHCSKNPAPMDCDKNSKYRTLTGACNNLQHPDWGMSETAQRRFLSPDYDDGFNAPRFHGVDGHPLPSPRVISNGIFRSFNKTVLDPHLTVLHMSYGQFIDHEFIATPVLKGENNSDIECCQNGFSTRPECIPIHIPRNDPFYTRSCMNVVRSTPAPPKDAHHLGVREQLNEVTSYADGSAIYGSSDSDAASLRTFHNGMLKTDMYGRLPRGSDDTCNLERREDYCQKAGDKRSNIVPNLGSVHMLFLREHNKIAMNLAVINPHWNDETLYQETRKIIYAIQQHITYNEYIALILNPKLMKKFGLYSASHGFELSYDPKIDASIRNVFGVAAFRFGHSQIPNEQGNFDVHGMARLIKPIEETFNRPHMVIMDQGRGGEGVMRWMTKTQSLKTDRFFASGIRDKLFQDENNISLDLTSLNIQRSRDHGVPAYNHWRKFCELPVAKSFDELTDHDYIAIHKLSKLYRHPDDIDLFAGAMSETPQPRSILGPTFSCLLSTQFMHIKRGDRFWYENPFHETGFTEAQLNSIKTITLSKLICNNVPIKDIQQIAFRVPGKGNPVVHCSHLPDVDLRLWKDYA